MQLPVIFASDPTGLIGWCILIILWAFGVLFVIIAIASNRSRKRGRGAGDPGAFLAVITTIISVLVQATLWVHYGRIEVIPLLFSLLPGLAGVICLTSSKPRR